MEEEHLDLTTKVYKLIIEHGKEGILQSTLWKELGLTSRDGSRLAIRLEKRSIIKREKVLDDGRWTYLLIPIRLPVQIKSIEQSPCIVCPDEEKCSLDGTLSPYKCRKLENWILQEYDEKQNSAEDA
ncbi:MAG: transcriptional regulator [Candidatus Methylarchaceae archaeon HK02M2]|nr:transcriptional regulator [Candidatus Methylarchaceae archaeon HK02M2]